MGFLEDNSIKAVAFDIDGTFYPLWKTNLRVALASLSSLPFAVNYNKARQRMRTEDSFLSLPPLSEKERGERMCLYMWNRCNEGDIEYFLQKEKKVFFSRYEKSFSSIEAFDHVEEVLEKLKNKHMKMGVLSDFPVGTKLKAMGIDKYFPIQLSSEDWGRYKPCLTPFEMLISKMDMDPCAILYVGDSLRKDIEGAKRAGLKTALLSKKEASGSAAIVFRDWSELDRVLF